MKAREMNIVTKTLALNESAFLSAADKGSYIPFGFEDFTSEMEDLFDSYWDQFMSKHLS